MSLWLALPLLLGLAASTSWAAEAPEQLLQPLQVFTKNGTVYAPSTAVLGPPLGAPLPPSAASSAAACAAACRQQADCRLFQFCELKAGCSDGTGGTLPFSQCQLLGANCSDVEIRSVPAEVTSGFTPVGLSNGVGADYGLQMVAGEGLLGADYNCSTSTVPGMCAFNNVMTALLVCATQREQCRSIVIYADGLGGCSNSSLAVLKLAVPSPEHTFVSPEVTTLVMFDENEQQLPWFRHSHYLYLDEGGSFVPPSDPGPAGDPAAAANGSAALPYFGCIQGQGVLWAGSQVGLLSNVPNREACCRACRQAQAQPLAAGAEAGNDGNGTAGLSANATCNLWHYCPAEQNSSCSYDLGTVDQTRVVLEPGQCQFIAQEMASESVGAPPWVIAKGPGVPFAAGAPMTLAGPDLPGFDKQPGVSMFIYGGFSCEDSIRPQTGECVLVGSPRELADDCQSNPECRGFTFKTANSTAAFGVSGGNATNMATFKNSTDYQMRLVVPTTVFYQRQQRPAGDGGPGGGPGDDGQGGQPGGRPSGGQNSTDGSSSSSSGLSGGDIAGIAVGSAALVAALAIAWALFARRRSGGGGGGKRLCGCLPSKATAAADSKASSSGSPGHTDEPKDKLTISDPETGLLGSGSGSGQLDPGASPFQPLSSIEPGSSSRSSSLLPASPAATAAAGSRPNSAGITAARAGAAAGAAGGAAAAGGGGSGGVQLAAGLGGSGESELDNLDSEETPERLTELLSHVEQQEARTLGSMAEGGGQSGQQQSSGERERQSATSGASGHRLVGLSSLPERLQEFVVDSSQVTYMRTPAGTLWELGAGGWARVFKAHFNGEIVAAKELDLAQSEAVQESFLREAQWLQKLRHANLVTAYGCLLIQREGRLKGVLLLEWCEGRSLQGALDVVAAGTAGLRLFGWYRRGRRVAYEVARALNYLHSQNIVHLDVKSANVLLTAAGTAKLADVGLARLQRHSGISRSGALSGTLAWMAPEMLLGNRCTQQVDIWSMGVLLWEIITGEWPQRGMLRAPRVPDECPQEAVDLMNECLREDPSQRPTARQLMQRLAAMQHPHPGRA